MPPLLCWGRKMGNMGCAGTEFLKNQQGSVALWLVFTFVLTFGSIALAVDGARLFALKTRLEMTAQTVALMAAKNLPVMSEVALSRWTGEIARRQMSRNPFPSYLSSQVTLQNVDLQINDNASVVTVTLEAALPATLLRALNFLEYFDVSATARARIILPATELVLALDSSLEASSSGKLTPIVEAAKYMTARLADLGTQGFDIKLAVIPHATPLINVAPRKNWVADAVWPENSVPPNVPGIAQWTGPLAAQRWCVGRRGGAAGTGLQTPLAVKFPLVLGIDKVTGSDGIDRFSITTDETCSVQPLRPFQTGFSGVAGYLSAITASGNFNGGRALIWSARLLSPAWAGAWGGAVAPPAVSGTVRKLVVLISASDGPKDADFSAGCALLRQQEIGLYILDFKASQTSDELYRKCVSPPQNYQKLESAADLRRTIADLVKSLIRMRLASLD